MNLDRAKQYILLKQSGELSPRRQRQLERYLAASEEARTFEHELLQMTRHTRELEVPPTPSFQVHQILDEARALGRVKQTESNATLHWRPALAYSAVALLVVAGWLMFSKVPSTEMAANQATNGNSSLLLWNDDFDEQLDEFGDQFAQAEEGLADDPTLDDLASELLELEGLQI